MLVLDIVITIFNKSTKDKQEGIYELHQHEINFLLNVLTEEQLIHFGDMTSDEIAHQILSKLRERYNSGYMFDPEYDYAIKLPDKEYPEYSKNAR